jgi:hypothetical protein
MVEFPCLELCGIDELPGDVLKKVLRGESLSVGAPLGILGGGRVPFTNTFERQ